MPELRIFTDRPDRTADWAAVRDSTVHPLAACENRHAVSGHVKVEQAGRRYNAQLFGTERPTVMHPGNKYRGFRSDSFALRLM